MISSSQQIFRDIVVIAHQFKKFLDIDHQYVVYVKHFIKFLIENIFRRYFRAFSTIIDRIRSLFSENESFRFWSVDWSINKIRFRKAVKIFEAITFHFTFIVKKNDVDSVFIDETSSRNFSKFKTSISSFIFDITKKISRDDMIFNFDNFNFDNSFQFNFDFIDVQRREFTKIIVNVLISRVNADDDDNDSNFNFSFDSVSQFENRINEWKIEKVDLFDSKMNKFNFENNYTVNVDRNFFYVDVYVFVDRFKNMIFLRDDDKLRIVIFQCLRKSVMQWHFMKLFDFEKNLLRNVSFRQWYDALIIRFKKRSTFVLNLMQKKKNIFVDAKKQKNSRFYAQNIFRHVKIVYMNSVFNQITLIWNNLY